MNRWQLVRAGLFNFWYYDEEEFRFADGKLLLRGSNGSGKSVTMQSLIPVLLDGKKSPDRLDPFGSRARRMEDYLLGEKEVSELNERTGYLYLEYQKEGTNQYLTTGIGLKAKRQSPLDFWGFVIWDNRRIGEDLQLYKTERALNGEKEKIPLTRRELENWIGESGVVVKTQHEYMELVNRYLFGFKSLEDYDNLIKLLIQLRSPKLSKDFKPTVVYEILNESLPSLSDDELRPLSDTIENMDQIKSQLDQIEREEQAMKRLIRPYDLYNQKVRVEKAEGLLLTQKQLLEAQKALDTLHAQRVATAQTLEELQHQEEALRREQEVLGREREALQDHDVFKAEKEKSKLQAQQRDNQGALQQRTRQYDEKRAQERNLGDQVAELEKIEQKFRQAQVEALEELDFQAEDAAFPNHEIAADEFRETSLEKFSFALWKKETQDYQAQLDQVLTALQQEAQAREKYQEAEVDLSEARKDWDEAQHQEKKWTEVLQEEQSLWVEQLFSWQESNQELALAEVERQILAQRVRSYPEKISLEELRDPLVQEMSRLREQLGQEILLHKHERARLQEQIKVNEQELESWQKHRDPEPLRHPLTSEARRLLEDQKIPYLPFYAAVEFKDQVSPEIRERLESALQAMGILDALVIPEKYARSPQNDRILQANPQILAYTLADYLEPTPISEIAVSAEDIDVILRTILIADTDLGEGKTSLALDGSYALGAIVGHAPQEESARYIGKEARRQLRLREIAKLEAQRAELDRQVTVIDSQLHTLDQRHAILDQEYQAFPSEKNIREAYDILYRARQNVSNMENDLRKKDEKVKQTLEAWRSSKARVQELSRTLTLPLDLPSYEKARVAMSSYREGLNALETLSVKLLSNQKEQAAIREHLESVCTGVDEIRGEINLLEGKQKTLMFELERVEARLKELGAKEIRQRIQEVIARLETLPREIEGCVEQHANLSRDLKGFAEKIVTQEQDLLYAQSLVQSWVQAFIEEENLQASFHIDAPSPTDSASSQESTSLNKGTFADSKPIVLASLLKKAKQIQTEFQEQAATRTSANLPDRENLRERINDAFNREMANLVEYHLTQQMTFETQEWTSAADQESMKPASSTAELPELWQKRWAELIQKKRRLQLVLDYEGKRVNPYYLQTQLEQSRALQRQLLNEKDRELYEEIIMNSVGRIIRGRIQRSEHWVEEMNALMAERDTSSGLRFRIHWKPRVAEHEDEMDTQDLVELLKADPRLLKENDMERITSHFRVKIERAKKQLEIKGFGESFHQIIKEMLDYRKWFEFRLFFQKEGEKWRELTDRAFYQFSGGEKAMAMYIPLFSAAYSRYSDARPDAPRIITLDEAFAGVDENNIRDMFDLLEKLGFNYIMNSQALWGDYDTVAHLAIAELVRPKNAPFVTVIRYKWDGKVRKLIT